MAEHEHYFLCGCAPFILLCGHESPAIRCQHPSLHYAIMSLNPASSSLSFLGICSVQTKCKVVNVKDSRDKFPKLVQFSQSQK